MESEMARHWDFPQFMPLIYEFRKRILSQWVEVEVPVELPADLRTKELLTFVCGKLDMYERWITLPECVVNDCRLSIEIKGRPCEMELEERNVSFIALELKRNKSKIEGAEILTKFVFGPIGINKLEEFEELIPKSYNVEYICNPFSNKQEVWSLIWKGDETNKGLRRGTIGEVKDALMGIGIECENQLRPKMPTNFDIRLLGSLRLDGSNWMHMFWTDGVFKRTPDRWECNTSHRSVLLYDANREAFWKVGTFKIDEEWPGQLYFVTTLLDGSLSSVVFLDKPTPQDNSNCFIMKHESLQQLTSTPPLELCLTFKDIPPNCGTEIDIKQTEWLIAGFGDVPQYLKVPNGSYKELDSYDELGDYMGSTLWYAWDSAPWVVYVSECIGWYMGCSNSLILIVMSQEGERLLPLTLRAGEFLMWKKNICSSELILTYAHQRSGLKWIGVSGNTDLTRSQKSIKLEDWLRREMAEREAQLTNILEVSQCDGSGRADGGCIVIYNASGGADGSIQIGNVRIGRWRTDLFKIVSIFESYGAICFVHELANDFGCDPDDISADLRPLAKEIKALKLGVTFRWKDFWWYEWKVGLHTKFWNSIPRRTARFYKLPNDVRLQILSFLPPQQQPTKYFTPFHSKVVKTCVKGKHEEWYICDEELHSTSCFISDYHRFASGCVFPLSSCDETSESEIVYSNKNGSPLFSLIDIIHQSRAHIRAMYVKGYCLKYGPYRVACRLNKKIHQFDKIYILPCRPWICWVEHIDD